MPIDDTLLDTMYDDLSTRIEKVNLDRAELLLVQKCFMSIKKIKITEQPDPAVEEYNIVLKRPNPYILSDEDLETSAQLVYDNTKTDYDNLP